MIPRDRKFTKEHEWVLVEDGVASIGLTDFAQHSLGDIVFVELPVVGDAVEAGGRLAVVESVKAAAGEVVEVNAELEDAPERINEAPWEAWIARVRVEALDEGALLDADAYEALVKAEEEKA